MGTRGVPAQYGGFETAVEEIGRRLVERGHLVTVYCRNPGQRDESYLGMRLVNLPAVRHRMTETLSHTAASAVHAIVRERPQAVLLMNAGNAPMLPMLAAAGIPTAIHLDGLESHRAKWRGVGARYYRWAESASLRRGQVVVADAQAMADIVKRDSGRTCVVIPYGAYVIDPPGTRLAELDLVQGGYHLVVSRFEPENHVREAVAAYRASTQELPLVVVGTAPYAHGYIAAVHAAAQNDPRIRFPGAVYDQELLDQLYAHALTYTHGHSVGGTNPSLLRAMGAGSAVLAYDVSFNREVTAGAAWFWSDVPSLTAHYDNARHELEELGQLRQDGQARIASVYRWDAVTDAYEELLERLAAMPVRGSGSRV